MHLELSASSMFILIVLSFPMPRRLYIEKGMMLMLAPNSGKALLKSNLLIEQGRIKLPRSFSFGGSWLRKRVEHLRFILTSSFSIVNGLLATSHGLNHCESLGRSYPGDRSLRIERLTVHSAQTFIKDFYLLMTIDILLCGLGRSAIPLDKGLYEEIPANNAEDPIDVIVSILVLVLEESVFPQFAHELTHDFKIDIASDFGFNHAGAWFSRDNAKYCSMVRVSASTPTIVLADIDFRERREIMK
ncbi:hypothetical protein Tco_0742844 [Tanacetum coccineum]